MLNILFSAVFILCSIGLLLNAETIPGASQWDIIGSRLFPQLMIAGMGLCSLVVFVDSIRKYMRERASGSLLGKISINRHVLVLFVALLVWIASIKVAGFYLSSLCFLVFLHWYLNGKRITPAAVITPVASLVAIYFIFGKFLRVILPEGILF